MTEPAGDIVIIEYPGPLVTRKFVGQVMHNLTLMLNDVTTGPGLSEERTGNSITIKIDNEPDNSEQGG